MSKNNEKEKLSQILLDETSLVVQTRSREHAA